MYLVPTKRLSILANRPILPIILPMLRRGLLILAVLSGGCARDRGRGIVDNDVTYKVPAIKEAVENKDTTSLPELVAGLRNEDPAVRFYSIGALKRLTGETFGYHYYDDPAVRKPAVQRWNQWLAEQGK